MLSQHYTLDNIKSRTVGDGQYGTARWATPKEISKTYQNIPFTPQVWRTGEHRPQAQGLVLGSVGSRLCRRSWHLFGRTIHPPIPKRIWAHKTIHALVDCDDIHCLMIGASGVGKTAFFPVSQPGVCLCQRNEYFRPGHKGGLGQKLWYYCGKNTTVIGYRSSTCGIPCILTDTIC